MDVLWVTLFITAWLLLPASILFALNRHEVEMTSYFDTVYFTWITLTTLGYGGHMSTISEKLWCTFMILANTVVVTGVLSYLASRSTAREIEIRRWRIASQAQHADLLNDDLRLRLQLTAKDGKHDRLSFITEILVQQELVQRVEVQLISQYFDLLDGDRSGEIDMEELANEARRVRQAREQAGRAGAQSKGLP